MPIALLKRVPIRIFSKDPKIEGEILQKISVDFPISIKRKILSKSR